MQLSPRRERRVGELGELGEVDIFDGHETYSLTDIGIDSYEDAIKINDKKSYWIASLFDVEAGKYFNFTTPNSVMLPITTSHKFRKINVEELLRLNLGREIGIEFDEDSIPDDLDARLHDLRFKVGILDNGDTDANYNKYSPPTNLVDEKWMLCGLVEYGGNKVDTYTEYINILKGIQIDAPILIFLPHENNTDYVTIQAPPTIARYKKKKYKKTHKRKKYRKRKKTHKKKKK
jgi:hypothetical protein